MNSITLMLDGADVPNLRLFFKEIVEELKFPRYTNNIQTFVKVNGMIYFV